MPVPDPTTDRALYEQVTDLGVVDQCIYCGRTDGLSDEHVIPYGLGRTAVLYAASCPTCKDKTSLWERRVLREMWLPFRTVLGMPTRHPKNRPKDFPARVRRGGVVQDERVPLDKVSAVALFPKLPPPGVYEDRPPSDQFRVVGHVAIHAIRKGTERNPARRAGVDAIEYTVPAHYPAFLRLLAKIAWGYTVARFGIGAVRPEILGIILGTDYDMGRWIGFPPDGTSVFGGPPTGTFRVTIWRLPAGFIVGGVQLFGPQGGPEYQVVVGSLLDPDAAETPPSPGR